jgi:hypothetical protein
MTHEFKFIAKLIQILGVNTFAKFYHFYFPNNLPAIGFCNEFGKCIFLFVLKVRVLLPIMRLCPVIRLFWVFIFLAVFFKTFLNFFGDQNFFNSIQKIQKAPKFLSKGLFLEIFYGNLDFGGLTPKLTPVFLVKKCQKKDLPIYFSSFISQFFFYYYNLSFHVEQHEIYEKYQ